LRVLVVDDDERLADLVKLELSQVSVETSISHAGATAITLASQEHFDAAIVDLGLPDLPGTEVIQEIRKASPGLPVVVLTARNKIEDVVRCMQKGARDFVQKPFSRARLVASVLNACEQGRMEKRVRSLTTQLKQTRGFGSFIGQSDAIQRTLWMLRQAAESDVTVLLQGESGTGKEVAARALHAEGPRSEGPFVALNCGAIPAGLIESELFGHEKGSFTGATKVRQGCFERADGGTLFLDEVSELKPELQVHLLRVLQERKFRRVGGDKERTCDVRVVAASNRNLLEEAHSGTFRLDLYYRLAVFPVELPPLQERASDVLLLAAHFLDRFAKKHERVRPTVSSALEQSLRAHPWPGNVRELENSCERWVILSRDGEIPPAAYANLLRSSAADAVLPEPEQDATPSLAAGGPPRSASAPGQPAPKENEIRTWAEHEQQVIEHALAATGGNIQRAADRLGLGRATIYRKIQRYGLEPVRSPRR
jgi:DNA-binding NtrC family response regulator